MLERHQEDIKRITQFLSAQNLEFSHIGVGYFYTQITVQKSMFVNYWEQKNGDYLFEFTDGFPVGINCLKNVINELKRETANG